MAGAPWQFTVLPETINEITVTQTGTSDSVVLQRQTISPIESGFTTSHFVETNTVIVSASGYQDVTVTVGTSAITMMPVQVLSGTFIDILVDSNNKVVTYNGAPVCLALPSEYTRVPYLESTGTQYINTGFYPTTDFKHTLVFEVTSDVNSNKYICGSGVSEGRSGNLRINGSTLNGLYIGTSSAVNIISTQNISLNTKYTIIMHLHQNSTNIINLNGTIIGNTSKSTISSTKPLLLWSLSNSYLPVGIRIYSSKIEQQNGQSYYFIPARRNSDSVLGMYDLISGTFKTNAGTGNFITEIVHTVNTLTLVPKYLDTYSGYYVTQFTVNDNNDNTLFQSDGSMGTKSISCNSNTSSIIISNLIRGNPTTTGLGCWAYIATNCTATAISSNYTGYYSEIILTNFTSDNPSIELQFGYGPVSSGPISPIII